MFLRQEDETMKNDGSHHDIMLDGLLQTASPQCDSPHGSLLRYEIGPAEMGVRECSISWATFAL